MTSTLIEELNANSIAFRTISDKFMQDGNAEAHNNLGVIYHLQGEVSRAVSE